MKLQPLHDKVIVRRDEPEKQKGNIILPDNAKEKPRTGTVVAVGPGRVRDDGMRNEMCVRKNDRVMFQSYAGHEVEVGGEKLLIMVEDDVMGVLEGE